MNDATEIWYRHDNTGRPEGVNDGDYIKCLMGDGTYSWSEAENFDWHHEADPIVAFLVLRKAEKVA
jgi:hypothetical protein